MANAVTIRGNGPISNEALTSLESEIGITFPNEYREFLRTYNGGQPEPCTFRSRDDQIESLLDTFFGISKRGDAYSLRYNFEVYNKRVPNTCVPIACDPGGNIVCLAVSGSAAGRIYFWDHEDEVDGGDPDYSNMYILADSFSEFLNSLYELVDEGEA